MNFCIFIFILNYVFINIVNKIWKTKFENKNCRNSQFKSSSSQYGEFKFVILFSYCKFFEKLNSKL